MAMFVFRWNQKFMKILKFFIPILLIFIAFILVFSSAISCLLIDYQGFKKVNSNIYVSEDTPQNEILLLSQNQQIAKERISDFWGIQSHESPLIYCHSIEQFQRFCKNSEGAGCSIGTPFGSWIIVNKAGLNADVIAHEMCHDEVFKRVGFWQIKTKIPAWFDEGLALMFDYRFVAATDSVQRFQEYKNLLALYGIEKPHLQLLKSPSSFSDNNPLYAEIAYIQAGYQVSYILAKKGKKAVFDEFELKKK